MLFQRCLHTACLTQRGRAEKERWAPHNPPHYSTFPKGLGDPTTSKRKTFVLPDFPTWEKGIRAQRLQVNSPTPQWSSWEHHGWSHDLCHDDHIVTIPPTFILPRLGDWTSHTWRNNLLEEYEGDTTRLKCVPRTSCWKYKKVQCVQHKSCWKYKKLQYFYGPNFKIVCTFI